MCPICMQGRDDTRHFIGACPAFVRERAKLQQQIRTNMFLLGKPGALVLSQLQEDPEVWFDTVLGAKIRIKLPNALSGAETHQFQAYAAKALWSLDKSVKNFLLVLWRKRRALLGDLTIAEGRIVRKPPTEATLRWYYRHQRTLRAPLAQVDLHSHNVREFWEPWLPYLRSYSPRQYKKNRRKNYFRVWEGHTTGVFYKWSDCKSAVSGYPGPKFLGFPTLEEAVFASDFN